MNKKILAVDLDDTLFNDDKSISQENIDALNKLLDAGHILAVDTGRPTHVMVKLLQPYHLFTRPNVYLLGFQGIMGYDVVNDNIIYGHYLDNDAAIRLLTYGLQAGLTMIAFEYGNIYSFRRDENVEGYAKISREPIEIIDSPEVLKGHNLTKIMVVNYKDHDSLHSFEDEHRAEMDVHFNSMFSNVAFLEYVVKGASKGDGLLELASYLDIPAENTIACGDERNDISMIRAAHIGVAVANARDELKAEADYITTRDNNHGAVAEAIYKFILDDN